MAEVLVSALSEVLIDKLISVTSQEIGRLLNVKGNLKKLHQTLINIQAVLSDAERRQVEDMAIKIWLMKLKDVVYDIEDIVEEFEYEALRRKLEIQGRILKKVRNLFLPSNPLVFRFKMSGKIKNIYQTLDEITRDKERFQFTPSQSNIITCFKSNEVRETSSHVDDSKIVGREFEKSKVINLLILNNNSRNHYSVVRIVGMGGVGKTTLAQWIYNDEKVNDHFHIKMWVCVSDNSTEKAILSNLLESINKNRCDLSSKDVMVSTLKQSLGSKRYLMVLDDVWNDSPINLEDMLTCFLSMGAEGSRIIITTRSDDDIPSMMDSIYTHRLKGLLDEECWSLFEKIAFGNGGAKKTPELIEIGKEIVKKCGGVPLAIKTLAGMMHSTSDEGKWLSIKEGEIWSLPEGEEKITRVLKLSYDHLPQQLKRCFSYCSIFPKDHIIFKENLIQLWMAEGFLGPSTSKSEGPINVGKEYFKILLRNSFFEKDPETWRGKKKYNMHDLVHDLALFVIGIEYSISDGWMIEAKEIERLRHVRLVLNDDGVLTIPEAIYEAQKLRTFISIRNAYNVEVINIPESLWDRMFLKLNYLRVMDLSNAKIKELPPSVGKLKHLRYIDLSGTKLERLPDSFTCLYNLQTLIIEDCRQLKELPKDMKKLSNLRHLITGDDTELTQMPRELGKLSLLERLSFFIVGKDKGYGIEELKDLNLLGGKIVIKSLENVRNGEDALRAKLKEKQNIRDLELRWTYNVIIEDDQYYKVLEGLQPHRNLKRLTISHYGASKFPTYHLPNLVSLTLWECPNCEYLPSHLGQLPCLQSLVVYDLKAVKSIGGEFYCSNNEEEEAGGSKRAVATAAPLSISTVSFPSLKILSMYQMPNLEEWSEDLSSSSSFPCLEELEIRGCSKLITTPTRFPSLKKLELHDCHVLSLMPLLTINQDSLVHIEIWGCHKLIFLPQSLVLQRLCIHDCEKFEDFLPNQLQEEEVQLSNSSLKSLDISFCPVLKSIPNLRGFNSLQYLSIIQCGSLKSLPDGLQCLTALEHLRIGEFSEDLNSFPFPVITEPQGSNDQCFMSLRRLVIYGWPGLKSLPDQLQHLILLQELRIDGFPSLEALPDWLGNLASLRELELFYCEMLMYLPSKEEMLRLTALKKLQVYKCPLLEERCSGEEKHKIVHIPTISFDRY